MSIYENVFKILLAIKHNAGRWVFSPKPMLVEH